MTTYLFILTVLAGASQATGQAQSEPISPVWKEQWVNAGAFKSYSCHKAASSLGLPKDKYRSITITGEVK